MSDVDQKSHPAWPSFVHAMISHGVSVPEMERDTTGVYNKAWSWFSEGWDAKIGQPMAQANNDWCNSW